MLEQTIENLKSYDWGDEQQQVLPINEAITAAQGDAAKVAEIEALLIPVLKSDVSASAKQFICRRLQVIGSAASVPALAAMLPEEELSHLARYALQSMPCPEAGKALVEALPQVSAPLKVGILSSLGVRGDDTSVAAIATELKGGDETVAVAAAKALGAIGTPAAKDALAATKSTDATALALADATLACAENLLASGNKAAAMIAYKGLMTNAPAKHVKLAATRGMLACAGKSD